MKITIHLIIVFIMSSMISTKANASTRPHPSGNNNDFEVLMQKSGSTLPRILPLTKT